MPEQNKPVETCGGGYSGSDVDSRGSLIWYAPAGRNKTNAESISCDENDWPCRGALNQEWDRNNVISRKNIISCASICTEGVQTTQIDQDDKLKGKCTFTIKQAIIRIILIQ